MAQSDSETPFRQSAKQLLLTKISDRQAHPGGVESFFLIFRAVKAQSDTVWRSRVALGSQQNYRSALDGEMGGFALVALASFDRRATRRQSVRTKEFSRKKWPQSQKQAKPMSFWFFAKTRARQSRRERLLRSNDRGSGARGQIGEAEPFFKSAGSAEEVVCAARHSAKF
jgi:hypothetical protein